MLAHFRGKLVWMITLALIAAAFLIAVPAAFAEATSGNELNQKCMACHGNKDFQVEREGKTVSVFVDVKNLGTSVHSKVPCAACHVEQGKAHPGATRTQLNPQQIMNNCAQCHPGTVQKYKDSDHIKANVTCSSCHGVAHSIQTNGEAAAPVSRANIVATCTKCHDGEIKDSYDESFHGKAVSMGSTTTPTCASCHGAHDIMSAENPKSAIAKANMPEICAKCHQEAVANFAEGDVHFVLKPHGPGAPMYYTYKFFTWLTIITITLLIIHIELELLRKLRGA